MKNRIWRAQLFFCDITTSIMMPYLVVLLVALLFAIHAFTLLPKHSLHQRSFSSSLERKSLKQNGMHMVIEKRAKADELPITLSGQPLPVQALKLYKDLNVPSDREKWTVPARFIVPEGNFTWPESMWGMKLGVIASHIKKEKTHKSYRAVLEFLGMDFVNWKKTSWDRTYAALKRYKNLYVSADEHANWTIPFRFVIPHNTASWPKIMWGMKLGSIASSIRQGRCYKTHRTQLESLGFDYSMRKKHGKRC